MTLLQSFIRLINPRAAHDQTPEADESAQLNPLGWYSSEEEKARGNMEDVIGDSLDKVRI